MANKGEYMRKICYQAAFLYGCMVSSSGFARNTCWAATDGNGNPIGYTYNNGHPEGQSDDFGRPNPTAAALQNCFDELDRDKLDFEDTYGSACPVGSTPSVVVFGQACNLFQFLPG